jgi:folate-dependent phosphoribosylglycinamide formyltransferase PurN
MASGIIDADLLAKLHALQPGCKSRTLNGARWGVLLIPLAIDRLPAPKDGFRLVLFASLWIGQAALQAVMAYVQRHSNRVQLVGVVTDDPVSPNARISLRKRAWALIPESERLAMKLELVGSALAAGAPVYTGEIKTPGFHRLLAEWQPDAIITCGFGQVLDTAILDAAPYGAYNCHPTDLANGHGAGPSPWEDMAARNVTHTVWSVHRMTEIVDKGPVIGQTAPINLADAQGKLVSDPLAFVHKVLPPIGWMILRTLDGLVCRHEQGLHGPLSHVELDASMPLALRRQMLQPVMPDWRDAAIPTPSQEVLGRGSELANFGSHGRTKSAGL